MKISCYILTPESNQRFIQFLNYVDMLTNNQHDKTMLNIVLKKKIVEFWTNPQNVEPNIYKDILKFKLNKVELIQTTVELVSFNYSGVFVSYNGDIVDLNYIDGIMGHNFDSSAIIQLN